MPSDPITLVRWRDASTDPPAKGDRVLAWTPGYPRQPMFAYLSAASGKYRAWDPLGAYGAPLLVPQPTVWCDPPPPGDDPLTLADLRRVLARAVQRVEDCELILKEKLPEDWQAIARVRALLPEEDEDGG